MTFEKIFSLMARSIKNEKVPCLLIGGFAVNYYRVSRQTLDVDFLITPEGYAKLRPVLERHGYREEYLREVFARLGRGQKDAMDLDFLFTDQATLGKMILAGKKVKLAEEMFLIPSLEHLLALKLHALKSNPAQRLHRDLLDILDLVRLNRVNFKTKKFHKLCLTYADGNIYRLLLGSLKHG